MAKVFLLVMVWQPLPAETPSIVTQLAAKAQEMATENVGLQAIIDYQTTLLPYSESNPEQAAEIRQTIEQCTALAPIGNLCELLRGTFRPPDQP